MPETHNLSNDARQHAKSTIQFFYHRILQREADTVGLEAWLSAWENGEDLISIANKLLFSDEFFHQMKKIDTQRNTVDCARALGAGLGKFISDTPIVIVDIGAQNLEDEEHVYSPIVELNLPTKIIGFEPLSERNEERLKAAPRSPNLSLVLRSDFIGDGQSHQFHVNSPDATSSLRPFNEEVIKDLVHLNTLKTIRTEDVQTRRLDDAVGFECRYVDFLKLDIQGFELDALKNSTETLAKTLVVHCEVSFTKIYKGQPLFSEVEIFMRDAGFAFIDFWTPCHYEYVDTRWENARDQLGWADAIFFKRLTEKSAWRNHALQSLIALSIYRKPSLASKIATGLSDSPVSTLWQNLTKKG